jgi:peptidoglycan/LPS O-acetylase OafA/YrhL
VVVDVKGDATRSRVAALTGLRGIAAASVVVYHVWHYGGPDGQTFSFCTLDVALAKFDLGVSFFFVLSGLLLYRAYARALMSDAGLPSVRDFAIGRFLRIVPVYWLAVLVVTALTERNLLGKPLHLLANLFFLEFWFPSFLPDDLRTSNGSIAIVPAWALVVEVGFYVTLPLLTVLAAWYAAATGRRVIAAFVPVGVLAVLGASSIAVEHALDGDARRDWALNFPMHASAFACGMAATTIWILVDRGTLRMPRRWRAVAVVAALAIALPSMKLLSGGQLTLQDARLPVAVSYALLLLLVVLSPPRSSWHRLFGARPLAAVGIASYSIFLVHDPIIRSLQTHPLTDTTPVGFVVALALVGVVTAGLASASYLLLEKRCFALKQRLVGRPRPEALRPLLERLITEVDAARLKSFNIEVGDVRGRFEPRTLSHLVGPLLQNAVVYGAAPYAIRASATDGKLHLVVEDSGRGVDESFVPKLFRPHMRSEPSSRHPGAGLGLSTARGIARDHGGDISYEPSSDGGARFAIRLPLRGWSSFGGWRTALSPGPPPPAGIATSQARWPAKYVNMFT